MRDAFTERGGREIDTAGGGFFVAFESARSAVAAAISAQIALMSTAELMALVGDGVGR